MILANCVRQTDVSCGFISLLMCKALLFTGSLWTLCWFNQGTLLCCQAATWTGMLDTGSQTAGICSSICVSVCLISFFFFFVSVIFSVFTFVFLNLCLFVRPGPSGDPAPFFSTQRSSSGNRILAKTIWSKRSLAVGQQTRPHSLHHRRAARTQMPP